MLDHQPRELRLTWSLNFLRVSSLVFRPLKEELQDGRARMRESRRVRVRV